MVKEMAGKEEEEEADQLVKSQVKTALQLTVFKILMRNNHSLPQCIARVLALLDLHALHAPWD